MGSHDFTLLANGEITGGGERAVGIKLGGCRIDR